MRPEQIWQAMLGELQLQIAKSTFETWLAPTEFMSCDSGGDGLTFAVRVDSAYAKDWLENHLLSTIRRTLTGIAGQPATAQFVVCEWVPESKETPGDDLPPALSVRNVPYRYQNAASSDLDPDSPIMRSAAIAYGRNLKECYKCPTAAAREQRKRDGKPETVPLPAYNLLLSGPAGVGKTHLAVAIGRLAASLGFDVMFVGADALLRALLNDIRAGGSEGRDLFKAAQECDLLILDDLNAGILVELDEAGSRAAARDPEASVSLLARSEWAVGEVKSLIQARYDARRGPAPIIVTSNQSANELQMSALDNATISRLLGGAIIAEIPQDALDYRFNTYQRPKQPAPHQDAETRRT